MHERTRKCMEALRSDFPEYRWEFSGGNESFPGGPVPTAIWFWDHIDGYWRGIRANVPEVPAEKLRDWLTRRSLAALRDERFNRHCDYDYRETHVMMTASWISGWGPEPQWKSFNEMRDPA